MNTICNKEWLVGYLYDELEAAERALFESHLLSCAECRDEVKGLRATRLHLTSWAPPEPDFGFRIVREPAPSRRAFWLSPAWGLAAAAVLMLAVAAAIAQVEVRYDKDGFAVRTGWARSTPTAGVIQAGPVPIGAPEVVDWKAQATALERRLAALEKAPAQPGPAVQQVSSAGLSDAQVLRRMKEMIDDSEIRQQSAAAARITTFSRAVDRRLYDMQQNIQATSGRSQKELSEMMNYLRVMATTQQPQGK
jgi:Putative zinc-finger